MHVLSANHLKTAANRFRDASKPIAAWRSIASDKSWRSPEEVRETFADAECAGDQVVFRIHQDKYRLVTTIHYSREPKGILAQGHVWIRSFLTRQQYENAAKRGKGVSQ
ncbi:MAG TPA: type II toxin-antitoxin system HigB family toxin [Acidobacteriaceae bacterium]|nr:type II toxin-antitoxin system HigB family toxin [Acidobacteriaceae bacterium]